MESLIGKTYVYNTVTRYKRCRRYFQEHLLARGIEDLHLPDINRDIIKSFQTFLLVKKGHCNNSMIVIMKCLKKLINEIIANGWMEHNPFFGIKFSQQKVSIRCSRYKKIACA